MAANHEKFWPLEIPVFGMSDDERPKAKLVGVIRNDEGLICMVGPDENPGQTLTYVIKPENYKALRSLQDICGIRDLGELYEKAYSFFDNAIEAIVTEAAIIVRANLHTKNYRELEMPAFENAAKNRETVFYIPPSNKLLTSGL